MTSQNPTSPQHQIRPAQISDAAEIFRLILELAEYEKMTQDVVATVESIEQTLFGSEPAAACLLAEVGGRIVGMAIYFTTYSTFLGRPGFYLEDLYVEPDFRGRGLGKQLLTQLAGIAVKRNFGRLEWSVLNWNEPSIEFYESLGAIPMQEWTVYRLAGEPLQKLGSQSA